MIGFVAFDNEEHPTSGWASHAGENSFRIKGVGDLASDVKWITNIKYKTFRTSGFSTNPKMRMSNFLKVDVSNLMKELGIDINDDPAKAVQLVSEIVDRVMRLSKRHYDIDINMIGDTLASAIGKKVDRRPKRSYGSLELDEALRQSYQTVQKCEGIPSKGSKVTGFMLPRIPYSKKLMEVKVPDGNWHVLDSDKIPKDKEEQKKWLIAFNKKYPCLCKLSVSNMDGVYGELLSFSNGFTRFKKGHGSIPFQRGWATDIETIHLQKYADVEIKSIMYCDSYAMIEDIVSKKLFDEGDFGYTSVSAGILAEAYWTGISTSQSVGTDEKMPSPMAVWIRAWDRILSFKSALGFANSGFHVVSYGSGGVWVAIPYGAIQDVIDVALEFGMIVPISLRYEARSQEEFS